MNAVILITVAAEKIAANVPRPQAVHFTGKNAKIMCVFLIWIKVAIAGGSLPAGYCDSFRHKCCGAVTCHVPRRPGFWKEMR